MKGHAYVVVHICREGGYHNTRFAKTGIYPSNMLERVYTRGQADMAISGDNKKLEVEAHELIDLLRFVKVHTLAVRPGRLLLQQGDDRLVAVLLRDHSEARVTPCHSPYSPAESYSSTSESSSSD